MWLLAQKGAIDQTDIFTKAAWKKEAIDNAVYQASVGKYSNRKLFATFWLCQSLDSSGF